MYEYDKQVLIKANKANKVINYLNEVTLLGTHCQKKIEKEDKTPNMMYNKDLILWMDTFLVMLVSLTHSSNPRNKDSVEEN